MYEISYAPDCLELQIFFLPFFSFFLFFFCSTEADTGAIGRVADDDAGTIKRLLS